MSFYTSVNRYGNSLLYRGYNDSGVAIAKRIKFEPTLYVPDRQGKSTAVGLDGAKLAPMKFSKMSEAKEFLDM